MEMLVTVAILLVLFAIAFPAYKVIRQRAHRQVAMKAMKDLGTGMTMYTGQNAGNFPAEDAAGTDTWKNAAKPEANDAWYNAVPRLIRRKGVGDFHGNPNDFYTKENVLFLPGATYPESNKKLRDPLFAIAFNTKLQRKDAAGKKKRTNLSDIKNASRTVILLEQGLPSEERTLPVQSKRDYDGSCKGSAKSFIGRYGGKGILYFADDHAELVEARDLLTETGSFPIPQGSFIWTCNPEENPNKNSSGQNIAP
jgi:type II secretory pathway pseudopilin PulG